MKDYTLSELKITCKEMHDKYGNDACKQCAKTYGEGFSVFCNKWIYYRPPMYFPDIEPHDMIRLPCVVHVDGKDFYQIFWRKKDGLIGYELKCTKAEADEFLAGLKEQE